MSSATDRPPLRLRDWTFTRHARDGVDARSFDPHEVVSACELPDISCTAYAYGPGMFRYVRGHLVVIAVPETQRIVTALLRSYDT